MTSRKKHSKVFYCVVAENTVVRKYGIKCNECLTLFVGSLVHVDVKISDTIYCVKVVSYEGLCYDESLEDYQWVCPAERLLPIDEVVWPILQAVSSPQERVAILKDKTLCNELCTIKVGCLVHIYCSDGRKINPPEIAVVKYKGPVAKKGSGIYFGVEMLVRLSSFNILLHFIILNYLKRSRSAYGQLFL